MRSFSRCSILLLGLLFVAGQTRAEDTNNLRSVVVSNSTFAGNLYQKLRAERSNFFFSPYSISTCLAMTAAGARGETASEMAHVLQFPTNGADVHACFGMLQERLNALSTNTQIELSIANALWVQKNHDFLPAFLEVCQKDYRATVKQADFKTAARPVRREINDWVAAQTDNKIRNLVPEGELDILTRLVLVNAVYFKGQWVHQFDKALTKNAPFMLEDGGKTEVPMMSLSGTFNYCEVKSLQVLEMPYAGGALSMVIFLPATNRMTAFESFVSAGTVEFWMRPMKEQKVSVHLPKFRATSQFSLADMLTRMGMTNAFKPGKADFSGIDGETNSWISAVVHKAFVDVSEEGTEAAAATGIVMGHGMEETPEFLVDRPFMFLIRDTRTGTILFMGRVADPTKAG